MNLTTDSAELETDDDGWNLVLVAVLVCAILGFLFVGYLIKGMGLLGIVFSGGKEKFKGGEKNNWEIPERPVQNVVMPEYRAQPSWTE